MERGRPEPNADLPETFGKYQLVDRLAVGGMAEIYRAKTTGIGGFEKTLVIKRLHDRLGQDDEFIDMLVDEAKIAVRLNHPNIGKVFDLGRIRDQYYIAMEYIEGPDLGRVIELTAKRGTLLPVPAVLFIGAECCSGLHYAHTRTDERGRRLEIVHRDVSPPNIMASVEGEVKIVDFGIAKARKRIHQTEHGAIKGKFHYMAPEQASGKRVDPRTDVFSVGMVLYELLGGRNPYEDVPEPGMVEAARAAEIPPLRQFRPKIDPELEQIIMQALHPNPEDRYRSAADFDRALTDYRERKCDPYDRRRLSGLVAEMWEEMDDRGGTHASPSDETGSMTPYEFEADESSIIHEVDEGQIHAVGELNEGAGEPGEFEEDAKTRVWDGGESTPGGPQSENQPAAQGAGHRPADQGPGHPQAGQGAGQQQAGQQQAGQGRGHQPAEEGQGNQPVEPAHAGQPREPERAEQGNRGGGNGGAFEEIGLDEESLPPPPDDDDAFEPVEPEEPEEPEGEQISEPAPQSRPERAERERGPEASQRDTTAPGESEGMSLGTLVGRLERAGIDRRVQMTVGVIFGAMLVAMVGLSVVALWPESNETETIGSSTEGGAEAKSSEVESEGSASLRVESSPPEAEVRVDGNVRGKTPTTIEGLDAAKSYEVEVRRKGYQIESREVRPSEVSDLLDFKLESSKGVLKVSTFPSDAKVELDGETIGYSPVTAKDIRRGETHVVRAELNGQSVEREVDWKDSDAPIKEIRLEFESADKSEGSERAERDERDRGGRSRTRRRRARRARARRTSSSSSSSSGSSGSRTSNRGSSGGGSTSESSDSSTEELNLFGDSDDSSGSDEGGSAPSKSTSESSGSSGEGSAELDIWGSDDESGSSGSSSSGSGGGGSSSSGGNGTLSVQVKKGWGKVYVDGKQVASETPLVNHSLEPGTYQVKVYYPVLKRSSEVRTITVKAGQNKRVIFDP